MVSLAAIPFAVNFVINTIIGLFFFAGMTQVPFNGTGQWDHDPLLGVGIVALITAATIPAKVSRAARAGLVAGLPATSRWRLLPGGRWPLVLTATTLAVAATFGLVTLLAATVPAGSDAWLAALVRGLLCALGAHLALVVVACRVLVGAGDHTRERAAALALAAVTPGEPFDSLDKGALAYADRARGISASPTWHLVIAGDIDDATLTSALSHLAARYPMLTTKVIPVDGLAEFAREFRYVAIEGSASAIPLRADDGPWLAARRRVHDHFIDIFAERPIVVTCVREPDRLHLFFQQHHAVADGRAFIGLLVDFATIVRALQTHAPLPSGTVPRRSEADAFGLDVSRRRQLMRRGFWQFLGDTLRSKIHPLPPLPWNISRDYTGPNDVVRVVVAMSTLESLRPVRERSAPPVSLNSLLTAAYLRAIVKWLSDRGQTIERLASVVVAETRPRDGAFVSFANHLTQFLALVRRADLGDLMTTARAVHHAVAAEAARDAHIARALFRGWGIRTVPMDVLRHLVLDVADLGSQVGFSNLIALPIPELAGSGWRVTDLWVTTPTAPPHGIAFTATHYAGTVSFNFNFKASVLNPTDVRALASHFVAELATLGPPIPATITHDEADVTATSP